MKTETVQEFLARGGTIKVIPQNATRASQRVAVQAAGGQSAIMSLEDGELFSSAAKAGASGSNKLSKELAQLKVMFKDLPAPLQQKELKRLKAMVEAGEIEDNGYFENQEA